MLPISYKALYRIFRPRTFADVVGQEHATRTLKNAIKENRISHAYLFNGPRGTGKTSAAKIFAKAVNCLDPQEGEPCNRCSSCIGIQDGSNMDIMEIDAASNRGVDEIRDIRDKVILRPGALKYKVYIIDEVHMLTTEAFNALLKTLEEPPDHVIFILATTEPHKLPLTIISRCQRFDFRKIPIGTAIQRLRWVCDQKGISISDETLSLIAGLSEGGLRDALSLLDQAYSFAGNTITLEDIHLITGTLSNQFLHQLVRELKENQISNVLSLFNGAIMDGKDPEQILKNLIQYFRDVLIYMNAPDLEEIKSRVELDSHFATMCNELKDNDLFQAIEFLNKVQNDLKWTSHPRILVEIALIQLCDRLSTRNTFEERNVEYDPGILQRIQQLERRIEELSRDLHNRNTYQTDNQSAGEEERRRIISSSSGDIPIVRLKAFVQQANPKYLQRMVEIWPSILEMVRRREVRTEAWLKQGKPVLVTDQVVLVAFNSPLHRDMTEKPENKGVIKEILFEKTKIPFELITIMQSQWDSFSQEYQQDPEEQTEQDPLIREAIQLVGEELVRIKNRRNTK